MHGHICKGKQPMQLVHLHPDLEKQRSLQRKLTEWWSQLNAKASLKRLVSLQSPPHWLSYDELPKSEVTSPKIFGGVGRNGMIPLLNNAAYSKAEPTRISFVSSNYWAQVSCYWPRTLFSVGNWLVKSLECPHTNRSTPCSYYGHSFSWIPTVAHSRIVYHVDIAICPDDLKWP